MSRSPRANGSPPIGELRRKHGHSRQTVAKAMRVLQDEDLIYKAVAEFIGDTEHTVISVYSHLMRGDRDKARRAMEDFMNGPAEDPSQTAREGSELKTVP